MMRGFQVLFALGACVAPALTAMAESGVYVPYSGIRNGTEGTSPVAVMIANGTDSPLECQAALAHWYSADIGQVAAGDTLRVTLWHNPENGVINLLNETRDRMPVEALWCADSAGARVRLHMDMRTGKAPEVLRFGCVADPDTGPVCTPQE